MTCSSAARVYLLATAVAGGTGATVPKTPCRDRLTQPDAALRLDVHLEHRDWLGGCIRAGRHLPRLLPGPCVQLHVRSTLLGGGASPIGPNWRHLRRAQLASRRLHRSQRLLLQTDDRARALVLPNEPQQQPVRLVRGPAPPRARSHARCLPRPPVCLWPHAGRDTGPRGLPRLELRGRPPAACRMTAASTSTRTAQPRRRLSGGGWTPSMMAFAAHTARRPPAAPQPTAAATVRWVPPGPGATQ